MEDMTTVGAFNMRHMAASEIAERSLVGAVLLNPTATFESVAGIVSGSDFGNAEIAGVYRVLEEMQLTAKPINDVSLVSMSLKAVGLLDAIGGNAGIARAIEQAMPHHAIYYATEIRRYAKIRKARDAAIAILAECEQDNASLQKIATIAAKRLLGVSSAMELIESMKGLGNGVS